MEFRNIILTVLLMTPITGQCADIAGIIKESSNRPAKKAQVTIQCNGAKALKVTANNYGRYRISGLPNLKWCKISVYHNGKPSNAAKINSGSGSKDINLRLQPTNDGWKLVL